MKSHYSLLQSTPLFCGLTDTELDALLPHLGTRVQVCAKGERLLPAGCENRSIGIVLSGEIEAARTLPDGTMTVLHRMGPGGVFGDVLSGSTVKSPVDVTACSPGCVLFLEYAALMSPCTEAMAAHSRVLQNLIRSISDKYFSLDRRIDLLLIRSLRARLCTYLLQESRRAGCDTFTLPGNRQAMAVYLHCERSALSRELSRMQKEGLLETYRGSFKLLDISALRRQCQAD